MGKAWEHLSCDVTQVVIEGAVPDYKYVHNKPVGVSFLPCDLVNV